ncbi:MAG: hypothetical protein AAGA47_01715 [Pseudomonadota bacterium]
MQLSADATLTSPVGPPPCPENLPAMLEAAETGRLEDSVALETHMPRANHNIVAQQRSAEVDIVNHGGRSKAAETLHIRCVSRHPFVPRTRSTAILIGGAKPALAQGAGDLKRLDLLNEGALLPGVIDAAATSEENPGLMAQRSRNCADAFGREGVIASRVLW